MHDILHFQHQFFEIFESVLGFLKGKIHFFPKVLNNWSSCQKNDYHFFFGGGGPDPKVIKITFFNPSLIVTTRTSLAPRRHHVLVKILTD